MPFLATPFVVLYTLWLTVGHVPTNVDVSWLLVVGDRLLNGETPYVDLIEVNPPFSIWLYLPFVLLERMTSLKAEIWLIIGTTVLAIASVLLSARIACRADPSYADGKFRWAIPAALFVTLIFLPGDFGQREHFAIIALLPWLALLTARDRDHAFVAGTPSQRVMAGVGAAAVVMVKPPHFVLAFVLPTLVLAFERKTLRPLFTTENIVGAVIVTAYLLAILVFHPMYLTDVFPLLKALYLPMREPMLAMVQGWPVTLALLAGATLLYAGGLERVHQDARILFFTALGFVPAFVVMGKGWPNHAMPFLVLGLLAFGIQLLHSGFPRALRLPQKIAGLVGLILSFQVLSNAQLSWTMLPANEAEAAAAAIERRVQKPTIATVAANMQPAHPLTRMVEGDFVSRYPSNWHILNAEMLLDRTVSPRERHELRALRDSFIAEIARDLVENRPDVVLSGLGVEPMWSNVVMEDPAVAAALRDYGVLYGGNTVVVLLRNDLSGERKALNHEAGE